MDMAPSTEILACEFTDLDAVDTAPALGVVTYGTEAAGPDLVAGVPTITLPMTRDAATGFREVWRCAGRSPVSGRFRGLCYAHDGDTLFVAGSVPRSDRYRHLVRDAYSAMLDLTTRLDYPYLFRIWNVVGDINQPNAAGLEIYRDFCQGRAEAFDTWPGVWTTHLCAATGIGAVGGGVGFYGVASKSRRPTHVENPRQMPAYQYPPQYGPRSPSFARASYLPAADGESGGTLYVSGTASVIGHATVHPGDLTGQLTTTLDNLRHLLAAVRVDNAPAALTLDSLRMIKVYVRHESDIPVVRKWCGEAFSPTAAIRYLNVDICRADLLVEIEGIAVVPGGRRSVPRAQPRSAEVKADRTSATVVPPSLGSQ
jgi:chorismatase